VAVVVAGGFLPTVAVSSAPTQVPAANFVLASADPALGGTGFPEKYALNDFGCTGGNESPPLRWSGAPQGTLSYVLTLFDMDEHNTPSGWWHWVVYDLPPDSGELREGAGVVNSKTLPSPAHQGRTDLGTDAYHGPCPDKGDKPHRYVFTLYALNVAKLSVPADSSGAMVVYSLQEHLLGKTTLVIRHGR
jgi:Raf kinase inhibitor-like YbhB/YbcL family protein